MKILDHSLKKVLGIWLIWVIATTIAAYGAPFLVEYRPSFPYAQEILAISKIPPAWYSWGNFDGVHYLTIAEKGYIGTGLIQAFFPAYPAVIALSNMLVSNQVVAGLAISLLGSLFAVLGLYFWLQCLGFDSQRRFWAVVVFLSFPTSFFLRAIYNEGIFLGLVFFCLFFAEKKRWVIASVLGIVATGTRLVGIGLLPAVLVIWWQSQATSSLATTILSWRKFREVFPLLLTPLGLVLYMIFLTKEFGDPLYFAHVQSQFGSGRSLAMTTLPQVWWRSLKIMITYQAVDWRWYAYIQEFLMTTVVGIGLFYSWVRIKKAPWRLSVVLFSTIAFVLPTLTGSFSSMPRYVLACIALWPELATMFSEKNWRLRIFLILSGSLLILNTMLFIQGYWIA